MSAALETYRVPPTPTSPVRVLVVDDSQFARGLLVHVLASDPAIVVVGVAEDGLSALAMADRLRPDVITMDIHMPAMDGYEATRQIMATCPTRIVMVTAKAPPDQLAASFSALESGALVLLERPKAPGTHESDTLAAELNRMVKLMAEVSVVRRVWPRLPRTGYAAHGSGVGIVAIGASTGGPIALRAILSRLPATFPAPIVFVQHIAAGFGLGFAAWLNQCCELTVQVAQKGERLCAGHAYMAPDGVHLGVDDKGTATLSHAAAENGACPSVSFLFRSVLAAYGGKSAGVLLTGMGRDGAEVLRQMRLAGALTVAQDAETAVVNGMPGEAVKLNAAKYVLPPEEIAPLLCRAVNSSQALAGRST